MTFDEFEEGKGRGESYPPGFTKRKILLFLTEPFPERIKEKKIRLFLKEEFDISGNTGVKRHLKELKEENCLLKDHEPGIANFWSLNNRYVGFKNVAKRFLLEEEDLTSFIRSNYVEEIIDKDFVDYFASNWAREYANYRQGYLTDDSDILGIRVKKLDDMDDEELRTNFYKYLQNLDKKKLSEILKVSPSVLKNFLFPNELFKDHKPVLTINVYFLYPFALDSVTIGAPEEKRIDTKLEIKYGNYNPDKKGNIDTILEAKSDYKTIGGSGKGKDANNKSK